MRKPLSFKHSFTALIIAALCLSSACGNGSITTGSDSQSGHTDDNYSETASNNSVREFENYLSRGKLNFVTFMKPHDVKGIYVSANIAGIDAYLDPLIELCRDTEINAMVIDAKSDFGTLTFRGLPKADALGISERTIPDIKKLINKLTENDIYPIARVVCFKDNEAAKLYPDIYIRDESGELYRDNSRQQNAWMNPYNRNTWNYIIDLCKEIAAVGFKEIQFDYVRFDTSSRLDNADYGETFGLSRTEIITSFIKYAVRELKPLGVTVSADVYGTIINSDVDANIVGQDYTELAKYLDVICPMIYPSHYAKNSMGIPEPDLEPYLTILESLKLAENRLSRIEPGVNRAVVRPWLQDFTATWLSPYLAYGGFERGEQIRAVYDSNLTQYLLWDAAVKYESDGVPSDQ